MVAVFTEIHFLKYTGRGTDVFSIPEREEKEEGTGKGSEYGTQTGARTKQQGFAFQTLLSRAAKMNFAFPSPIFAFVLSARTDRQLFSRNPLPLPFAFPIFEFVFPPFDLRHEVQICLPVFRFYFRLDTFRLQSLHLLIVVVFMVRRTYYLQVNLSTLI